jgi:hypothetical protein
MAKKHTVELRAKKPVSVPVRVKFQTDGGKKASFPAHKTTKKKVTVKFWAKDYIPVLATRLCASVDASAPAAT